jgi:hypothetical protein
MLIGRIPAVKTLTTERLTAVAFISIALLLIVGCPRQRSISDILRDPAYFTTRDVAVVGTVTHSYGALGTGVYEIDDGTGKMWVFAETTGVPSNGARVATYGRIQPTLTFGGRNFATVLRERQRKRR